MNKNRLMACLALAAFLGASSMDYIDEKGSEIMNDINIEKQRLSMVCEQAKQDGIYPSDTDCE